MRCPVCDVDLFPSPIRGRYIDGCPGCFGSFCVADALLVEVVLESPKKGLLGCPACESPMHRGTMFKGRLTLDRCSACAGVWFDAYELDRLAQLSGVEAAVGDPRVLEPADVSEIPGVAAQTTLSATDRGPRRALAALALACALYAAVRDQGSSPLAVVNRIVASRVVGWIPWPERYLRPDVLLEGLVGVEAFCLWSSIAFLTAFVLYRFLVLAVPAEGSDSAGTPPQGWRRHETEPSEPNRDEVFESLSHAAQNFVSHNDKEGLIQALKAYGFESGWVAAHRERRVPTFWILISSAVGLTAALSPFTIAPGRPLGLVIAALVLGGLGLGAMIATGFVEPRLRRANLKARGELLARWEARLGAG